MLELLKNSHKTEPACLFRKATYLREKTQLRTGIPGLSDFESRVFDGTDA
jgi:hypothetical protein